MLLSGRLLQCEWHTFATMTHDNNGRYTREWLCNRIELDLLLKLFLQHFFSSLVSSRLSNGHNALEFILISRLAHRNSQPELIWSELMHNTYNVMHSIDLSVYERTKVSNGAIEIIQMAENGGQRCGEMRREKKNGHIFLTFRVKWATSRLI